MAYKKYTEKLNEYYERLNQGKARKIQPSHVEKIIRKLKLKEQQIVADIEETAKESKKERLEKKLRIAREHIKRAEWLLAQVVPTAD